MARRLDYPRVLGKIVDAVQKVLPEFDERELENLLGYVTGLTSTNCPWGHYAMRIPMMEFVRSGVLLRLR